MWSIFYCAGNNKVSCKTEEEKNCIYTPDPVICEGDAAVVCPSRSSDGYLMLNLKKMDGSRCTGGRYRNGTLVCNEESKRGGGTNTAGDGT